MRGGMVLVSSASRAAWREGQKWDISKAREFDWLTEEARTEAIAEAAFASGCRWVAFTYILSSSANNLPASPLPFRPPSPTALPLLKPTHSTCTWISPCSNAWHAHLLRLQQYLRHQNPATPACSASLRCSCTPAPRRTAQIHQGIFPVSPSRQRLEPHPTALRPAQTQNPRLVPARWPPLRLPPH